jgi:two-component sensor histidine kinase
MLKSSALSNKNLRERLRTILVLVWSGMALAIMTGILLVIYRGETENWRVRQGEASRNSALIVDGYIQQIVSTLGLLDAFGRDEFLTSTRSLQNMLADQPALEEIVYLDSNGTVLASVARTSALLSDQFTIPQSEWFLAAEAGKPFISRVQVSAEDEPYMIVSLPSRADGVIAARVKMQILWDVVRDIRFGEQGNVYVVNLDGRVMAHTDPGVVLRNRLIADLDAFQAIIATPGFEWSGRLKNFTGETMVGTSLPIPTTGWIVITELPLTEAYAGTLGASWFIPLALIFFSVLSVRVIEHIIDRLFLDPIDQLSVGAEHVGRGELSYRVPVLNNDELGRLAQSFNDMTASLGAQRLSLEQELQERRKIEELLRDLNEDLENRVASRTLQLSTSLKEKDVLLKEVHHRVKNNLQVVSSLLSLQARKAEGAPVQSMLVDSQSRIHSMALIHEKLYQSESLEVVDLGGYIHTLASYLFQTYNTRAGIRLDIQADLVYLSLNQAVPCGLLINEVVTNALKYAFAERPDGVIRIEVRNLPDGMICIQVADNGRGLDHEISTYTTSLGMQLIHSLTIQLDGDLTINRQPGVEYILTFKGES